MALQRIPPKMPVAVRLACHVVLIGFFLLLSPDLTATPPPSKFPNKLALVQLLRDRELEALDALIDRYQRAYDAGAFDESQLQAAYFAFADSSADLEKLLDSWVQRMPNSFPAHMARGIYFWNLGLLTRGPRSGQSMSVEHNEQFRTYFVAASADLIQAVEHHRQLGIAYSLLIHMANDLGDSNDIIELARRGAIADPHSVSVHRRFLDTQRPWVTKTGENIEFSLARIERYVGNLTPKSSTNPALAVLGAYPMLVRAELMVRHGDRQGAMVLYDQVVTYGHWIYWYRRGVNHFRMHDFERALHDFDRALMSRPQAAEILNMRARALRALGRMDEATLTWAEAMALNPRDPKLLLHRASALRDDGDFAAAAGVLTKALELGRNSPYIWDARGRIYLYDLQHFDKAVSDLKQTLAFAPDSQRYWFNYATALYKKRDCEAVSALRYYLTLCETRSCPADSIQWTKSWSDALHQSYECRPPAPLAETQYKGD